MKKAFSISIMLIILFGVGFANIKTKTLTREDYGVEGPVASLFYTAYEVKESFGSQKLQQLAYLFDVRFDQEGRVIIERPRGEIPSENGLYDLEFAPFELPIPFPVMSYNVGLFAYGTYLSFECLSSVLSVTSLPVIMEYPFYNDYYKEYEEYSRDLSNDEFIKYTYDEKGKLLLVERESPLPISKFGVPQQKYIYGNTGLLERVELIIVFEDGRSILRELTVFQYDSNDRIQLCLNYDNRSFEEWQCAKMYSYDEQGNVVRADRYINNNSSTPSESYFPVYENGKLVGIEVFAYGDSNRRILLIELSYDGNDRICEIVVDSNHYSISTVGFILEYTDENLISKYERYSWRSGNWELRDVKELSYEFDKYGNWTSVTFYEDKEEFGKVQRLPTMLFLRGISYYE